MINPTNQTVPDSTSVQVQESVPLSHSELSIPSGAQGGGGLLIMCLGSFPECKMQSWHCEQTITKQVCFLKKPSLAVYHF